MDQNKRPKDAIPIQPPSIALVINRVHTCPCFPTLLIHYPTLSFYHRQAFRIWHSSVRSSRFRRRQAQLSKGLLLLSPCYGKVRARGPCWCGVDDGDHVCGVPPRLIRSHHSSLTPVAPVSHIPLSCPPEGPHGDQVGRPVGQRHPRRRREVEEEARRDDRIQVIRIRIRISAVPPGKRGDRHHVRETDPGLSRS